MLRRKGLARRTPLLPGQPKRRPSVKRKAFAEGLDAVTPMLMARADYRCEMRADERCDGTLHRHHRMMRSQGGDNSLRNLMLVCEFHHRVIHAEPLRSYHHGWLIHSWEGHDESA